MPNSLERKEISSLFALFLSAGLVSCITTLSVSIEIDNLGERGLTITFIIVSLSLSEKEG